MNERDAERIATAIDYLNEAIQSESLALRAAIHRLEQTVALATLASEVSSNEALTRLAMLSDLHI